jgi:DNA polymerase-3 subunit delta'
MPPEPSSELSHPRLTPHLRGHTVQWRHLTQAFADERFAHAWMLTGTEGVGKATFAYHLARWILASTSRIPGEKVEGTDSIAATHPVFRRMMAQAHSDFCVVERPESGGEIGVDAVRHLCQFMRKTAGESAWRVAIVDDADHLNRNAANALLKMLEEPPARTALLLVTHQPGRVLPTLRSRCRKMAFHALGQDIFRAIFTDQGAKPEGLDTLWDISNGVPGRALRLQESDWEPIYTKLLAALALYPHRVIKPMEQLADAVGGKDDTDAFDVLRWMLDYLFQKVVALGLGKADPASAHPTLARLAQAHSTETWLEYWARATRMLQEAHHLHLDRRHATLTMLHSLHEPLRYAV